LRFCFQLGELDLDSGRNQFLTKGANWRARHVLRKWFVTTCLAVLFVYSTDRPIVGLLYRQVGHTLLLSPHWFRALLVQ
jgi:hypothetical protein